MGRRFSDMDGIQFGAAVKGLMGKLTAIAGWRVPETDGSADYATVFTDQLNKFVYEQCGNITLSELEYAVRKYGVDLSDWGKPMHLGLLSACINPYLELRISVSKMEEQAAIDQKQAKTEVLTPVAVDWTTEWQNVIYAAKIGQISNCWITTDLYEWLIREKIMDEPTKEDKWEVVRVVAKQYLADIKDALLNGCGVEPPYEIKRRVALLENQQAPIWKKDTAIMSTLQVMAKREMVRQAAIIHVANYEA